MSRAAAFLPTRRLLLAGLGLGAVGVAAAPFAGLSWMQAGSRRTATWWDKVFPTLKNAGVAEWTALVGEMFTMRTGSGDHYLRIVSVKAFPKSGARPASLGRTQAFAVVFEQMAGKPLAAADLTFQLTHRSYPPLPIYMSAPSMVARAARLVAVFN